MDERKQGGKRKRRKGEPKMEAKEGESDTSLALGGHGRSSSQAPADTWQETHQLRRKTCKYIKENKIRKQGEEKLNVHIKHKAR
jgi:hypothetical protein